MLKKEKKLFLIILDILFVGTISIIAFKLITYNLHKKEKIITYKVNSEFEPSGITKCKNNFYIISDEGTLAKFNPNKKIEYFSIQEELDLEGITCENNSLYVAEEGRDNILKISFNGEILKKYNLNRYYNGKKVISKEGDGLESLAFYKETSDSIYFYTSNQSDEFTGEDKSAILLIKLKKNGFEAKIEKYYPLKIPDISAIFYKNGIIYFISDTMDTLYKADENLNIIGKYKIPGKSQEGLYIENGLIYIADDSGKLITIKE